MPKPILASSLGLSDLISGGRNMGIVGMIYGGIGIIYSSILIVLFSGYSWFLILNVLEMVKNCKFLK